MINNSFNIDEKIKKTFRLFAGIRPVEEDQKIYDKVLTLCFDEFVAFIEENLNTPAKNNLLNQLEKADIKDPSDKDKVIGILIKHAQKIENFNFRWDKRADYFLNQLLYSAVQNTKKS